MRLLIRFVFIVLLLPSWAHALACVTTATGNWSTTGTWTSCGGGVPGDGDTAEIDHNVTVTSNTTVGTDGALNTDAIRIDAGSLTVNTGVVLTVKGSINVYNNDFLVNGTAQIDFLVTNNQRIYLGDNYQGSARMIVTGTSVASPATISVNAGSTGTVTIDSRDNAEHPEYFDARYVSFEGLGSSSVRALDLTSNYTGDLFRIRDSIFDGCGAVYNTFDPDPALDWIIQRVTFRNGTDATNDVRTTINTDKGVGVGTWLFDNNVVEGHTRFYSGRDLTITNNLFYGDVDSLATTGDTWDSFSGNLIRSTSGSGYTYAGDTTNNYFFMNNSAQTNPHYFQTALNVDTTHDGNVIEFDGADDQGDGYLIHAPGSAATVTIQNNLFLCGTSTNGIGTLFSALGGTNVTIAANHNTWCVGSQGTAVGETYAGRTGLVSSFQSNIGWNQAASAGYLMFDSGADDNISDLISSSNFDFNLRYNLLGVESNLEFSAGTPNSNGWNEDPQFVDDTRDLADWDSSLGGLGTAANALDELRLRNDSSWDSNYNIAALVTYVKGGFAVQNSNLEDAGHDSVTVGCCGFQAASSGGSGRSLLMGIGQ